MRNTVFIRNIYSDQHEALIIVIYLYWSETEQSGLMLLLLYWMHHHGYLASSFTVVTFLLLLWRQGWSAAERRKEGPGSCARSNILAKCTFFSKLETAALTTIHTWAHVTLATPMKASWVNDLQVALTTLNFKAHSVMTSPHRVSKPASSPLIS